VPDDAVGRRAEDAHAGQARRPEQVELEVPGSVVGEAAGDDHERARTERAQVRHGVDHRLRLAGDEGEIELGDALGGVLDE
jgi:hypothetical protein